MARSGFAGLTDRCQWMHSSMPEVISPADATLFVEQPIRVLAVTICFSLGDGLSAGEVVARLESAESGGNRGRFGVVVGVSSDRPWVDLGIQVGEVDAMIQLLEVCQLYLLMISF